ncbi:MAG TPA: HDIG domain-containing protein [Mollicutes bacterium]|nr:HDIG domain-containing protein [Mollicutes bacterium]
MINNIDDKQYKMIVDYIMKDKEFNKISSSFHHGTDRLTHSIKVSYYSYLITKKLGLDYKTTATAGLLHDFFVTSNDKTFKESASSLFNHAKIAAKNAVDKFEISDKEKNIIETHMFPLTLKPSKFIEGWIVSFVDKGVGIFEFGVKFRYAITLWLIFVFNIMK